MQKIIKTELSPCPFCGSSAEEYVDGPYTVGHGESETIVGVRCTICGGRMSISDYAGGNEDFRKKYVVERWNRRIL